MLSHCNIISNMVRLPISPWQAVRAETQHTQLFHWHRQPEASKVLSSRILCCSSVVYLLCWLNTCFCGTAVCCRVLFHVTSVLCEDKTRLRVIRYRVLIYWLSLSCSESGRGMQYSVDFWVHTAGVLYYVRSDKVSPRSMARCYWNCCCCCWLASKNRGYPRPTTKEQE